MIKLRLFFIILFLFFFNNAISNENYYLSLKYNKVNVRYGPGIDYPIKFIYKKRNFPVEIVDKKENFRKIEDYKKNSGWIHISQLKKNQNSIVLSEKVLFKKPTKFSEALALLAPGRLIEIKKCDGKWCKISTLKYSGWVTKKDLWGLKKF